MITERISRFIADLDVELKNQTYAAKVIAEKIKLLKQDQQSLIAIFEREGDNLYQKNFYGIYRDGTRIYDFKSNEQSFGEDLFGTKRMADIYERDLVSDANVKQMLKRNEVEDRIATERYNKKRAEEILNKSQTDWEELLLKKEREHEEQLKEYAKDLEFPFNELGMTVKDELVKRNSEKELKELYEDLESRGITVSGEVVKEKIESSEEIKNLVQEIAEEYQKEFPNDLVEVHKS